MKQIITSLLALALLGWAVPAGARWKVISETAVSGFGHPESVGFDPQAQVLYVSRFGPELKALLKDAKGFISRVDLKGQILEERSLPGPGVVLHKPKGVWVAGPRLWTTDIDAAWVFDLKTKKGHKVPLPGARFANDPVVSAGRLFVSDMGTGTIYVVEPADFITTTPHVSTMVQRPGLFPNGLWVNDKGELLFGTAPREGPLGRIYKLTGPGQIEAISPELGRIDGLAVLSDGTILYTDWAGKGLFALGKDGTSHLLAAGFSGPADFAVVPRADRYLVVVPDLVEGDLRIFVLEQ